jgi:hypothetical protein
LEKISVSEEKIKRIIVQNILEPIASNHESRPILETTFYELMDGNLLIEIDENGSYCCGYHSINSFIELKSPNFSSK